MKGELYRLNIHFDLTYEYQRKITEKLQFLDRKQYGFINKFVIAAVDRVLDGTVGDSITVDEVRRIIREELQEVTFVLELLPQTRAVVPILTEDEQAENEQSILDNLEMFG